MKRPWGIEELPEHWQLLPNELAILEPKKEQIDSEIQRDYERAEQIRLARYPSSAAIRLHDLGLLP